MRYRKKPIVIDANQWLPEEEIPEVLPPGMRIMDFAGMLCLEIPTLEGTMVAVPGDWVIRGIKGEYYPCKPDIFEASYELAE